MPLNVDVKTLVQIWEALVLNVSLEEVTISTVVSKFSQFSWRTPSMLTIHTNHLGGNLVQKHWTIKFDVVGEGQATKYIQIIKVNRINCEWRMLSPEITQRIFSEDLQTESCEPFDFPTTISGFPSKWQVHVSLLCSAAFQLFFIAVRRTPLWERTTDTWEVLFAVRKYLKTEM